MKTLFDGSNKEKYLSPSNKFTSDKLIYLQCLE